MSQPVAVSSAICCSVALMSAVRVVVIDCTVIGASPPTSTDPTLIWRLLRRGARVGGGRAGMPSETAVTTGCSSSERIGDRVDDVGEDGHRRDPAEYDDHQDRERDQLVEVDRPRVAPAERAGQPGPGLLEPQDGDVAAV